MTVYLLIIKERIRLHTSTPSRLIIVVEFGIFYGKQTKRREAPPFIYCTLNNTFTTHCLTCWSLSDRIFISWMQAGGAVTDHSVSSLHRKK